MCCCHLTVHSLGKIVLENQADVISNRGEGRVGHRVLLHYERVVLLRSFKARNILLHSCFKFLATYETQKNNVLLFCILF